MSYLSLELVTGAFLFAYGLVFLTMAALVLAPKGKTPIQLSYAALLADFGLMCLAGCLGVPMEDTPAAFYAATYAFMLFLAPLASRYVIELLGDAKRRRLPRGIALATGALVAAGLVLGFAGLDWHAVFCLAYAFLFLVLALLGAAELRDIGPIRAQAAPLRRFFLVYFGVAAQVLALLVAQSLELSDLVHALWVLTAFMIPAHGLLVTRHPELYTRLAEMSETGRQGRSRLVGMDARAYIERLRSAMEEDESYKIPNLQLEDLSARIGLSAPQLSELLNRCLGLGFSSYVNSRRVAEARRLLLERPAMGILEIGFECGFSSKSSFNTVFRKETGMSPSEFRRAGPRGPIEKRPEA